MMINIQAGWVGFALGCVAGAVIGLFFHDPNWLGGYASWPRRMLRLGHIALFGIGILNLFFGLTVRALGLTDGLTWISHLLLVAAVGMPERWLEASWFLIIPLLLNSLVLGPMVIRRALRAEKGGEDTRPALAAAALLSLAGLLYLGIVAMR